MRFWTGIFILFGLISIVIWDFAAYFFGGEGATISVVITDFAQSYPYIVLVVPYILGMLSGHFFIPAKGSKDIIKKVRRKNV